MKKFSIGLVAVLMAIGFAAFTQPQKLAHKKNSYSYRFTESTNANRTDPSKYILSESADGCNTYSEVICLIDAPFAPDMNNHPTFSSGTDPLSNNVGITVSYWKP